MKYNFKNKYNLKVYIKISIISYEKKTMIALVASFAIRQNNCFLRAFISLKKFGIFFIFIITQKRIL